MENGTHDTPRPRRGRRPAADVRADVLLATSSLLAEEGLRAVTFDRVAAKSGASKTTIYKWWASPGSLAAESYFSRSEAELVFHDSGDVVTDIRAQLHSFVGLLTEQDGGRVIAELIGAAQGDRDLSAAVSEHYTMPRRMLAIAYFEKALTRGQIRRDVDPSLLVDQLWGACYNRLLIPDAPLDTSFADALVENTLKGAASIDYRTQIESSRGDSRQKE